MNFYTYLDSWTIVKNRKEVPPEMTTEDFYTIIGRSASQANDPFTFRQTYGEVSWIALKRPYYSVWPKIVPLLCKLDLSKVISSQIKLPLDTICLRFAQDVPSILDFDWGGKRWNVRCVMASMQPVTSGPGTPLGRGITIWTDFGETVSRPDGIKVPVFEFRNFPLRDEYTVDVAIHHLPWHQSKDQGVQPPMKVLDDIVRLVCTICLMGNDPDLIEPDILSADQEKYNSGDAVLIERLIDKAKRRGKFGFNVGRNLDVSPHYRRAHPALMWTGHGRIVPRVVMRKGAMIHRDLVEKVPTGHQGAE